MEVNPATRPEPGRWQEAADLLEQAVRVGKATPETSYLLAMCYKRLGKTGEARTALRRITQPDANVALQLGLLSFAENQYEPAEQEFARALQIDPQSYAAAYNMLLCRLALGQPDRSAELLPQLRALARTPGEQRFLSLLEVLLRSAFGGAGTTASSAPPYESQPPQGNGPAPARDLLAGMTEEEEQALVQLLEGLPQKDIVFPMLQHLAQARPHSEPIQRAYMEMVLVHAKRFADRCQWNEADQLLAPLARLMDSSPYAAVVSDIPTDLRVAFLNLQGCCACMLQDFDRATRCLVTAIKWAGDNAWLYQNLALISELSGRAEQAEAHWNRYFDLINSNAPAPRLPNYLENLVFAGLFRLAELYTKQERWNIALSYVQRAHRLRPRDVDTLEKLFHLYHQVRRPEDARRALRKMRELRPDDPKLDLYELDLREVRSLEDLDRMFGDIKKILSRYPGDMRVEERAAGLVANCIPLIARKCDQLSQQLGHIAEQVRRLPNYQINWPVVHDEMHHLRHELQKLRRLANKCLALVTNEDQRRVIRDLNALIDSKIDVCISLGG
jgi:tetratricopeptide (TPR) repeat protein